MYANGWYRIDIKWGEGFGVKWMNHWPKFSQYQILKARAVIGQFIV